MKRHIFLALLGLLAISPLLVAGCGGHDGGLDAATEWQIQNQNNSGSDGYTAHLAQ